MKRIVTCIFLIGVCFAATADSLKLELFDRCQALHASAAEQESKLILEIDSSLASLQEELRQFEQLNREVDRICVVHMLEHSPAEIEWRDPYFWGFSACTTKAREILGESNERLKSLLHELETRKEDLRRDAERWNRYNAVRRAHQQKLTAIQTILHDKLMALQKEMDALLTSAQPPPEPDG